jgi:hypothetical protein
MSHPTNAREALNALGIGNFNATMVIQYMFIAPATTDPKSPPIMVLVRAIQDRLRRLGYPVPSHGYLDVPTANAITAAVGAGWQNRAWGDTVKAVLAASPPVPMRDQLPEPMGALPTLSLPAVPGGAITYAAAGAALYYFLVHKKRR